MGLFSKKITVYKEKGCRADWKAAKRLLKEHGIDFSSTELPSEAPTCGCGAKLDIRDFGPKGKIDRNFYYIDVAERRVPGQRAAGRPGADFLLTPGQVSYNMEGRNYQRLE